MSIDDDSGIPESKIWTCKMGPAHNVPEGGDWPMRKAVIKAYEELTGQKPSFCFSGWGGKLNETERAVVENRVPQPDMHFRG